MTTAIWGQECDAYRARIFRRHLREALNEEIGRGNVERFMRALLAAGNPPTFETARKIFGIADQIGKKFYAVHMSVSEGETIYAVPSDEKASGYVPLVARKPVPGMENVLAVNVKEMLPNGNYYAAP
ncbi:hypothetical protein G6N82_06225 [Altererythrobacter sp. BO-6]|uniref:hypothetical protein n=1 Tax=Altererythrobacter sp. BO-6 TaxID=2604537 RepID=UPI0013E1F95C|nr:hypothetical protein [Altererythrobacter sp. BO-6]QIG53806.1 hypothetical protein G6N82_06225 [Altererythrobacter sp. BO-6]